MPYLAVAYLLERIRKTGFANPYKKRFQIYWYVSLVALVFGVRARSVAVETPFQRLIDLFVLVGVSFATYYFIEDVTEIFRREQISPKVWPRVRRLSIAALLLQVAVSFMFAFHQFSGFATSMDGFLGLLLVLYVAAWGLLVYSLHTATTSAGAFIETRLEYGTVVPLDVVGNLEESQSPYQFNLMTIFFLMLGSACAIEYWNQPPSLTQVVVSEAKMGGESLRLHVGLADQQAKLIIVERSSQAFAPGSLARKTRERYLMISNTKVWARRYPRMYLYDRDADRFRRLKLSEEARRDAAQKAISASEFLKKHVASQVED